MCREYGELVFEPRYGPGEYHLYYRAYSIHGSTGLGPNVKVHYDALNITASAAWIQRYGLNDPTNTTWRHLPAASAIELQSRTTFGSFTDMELIAFQSEVEALIAQHAHQPFIVFTEERQFPLRMTSDLPLRWIQKGASEVFRGHARRGEYFVFQIAIYAYSQNITIQSMEYSPLYLNR
jgi:hypothetical protein